MTYDQKIFERTAALTQAEPGAPYRGTIELPADPRSLPFSAQASGSSIGWYIEPTLRLESTMEYTLPEGVVWAMPERGAAAPSD